MTCSSGKASPVLVRSSTLLVLAYAPYDTPRPAAQGQLEKSVFGVGAAGVERGDHTCADPRAPVVFGTYGPVRKGPLGRPSPCVCQRGRPGTRRRALEEVRPPRLPDVRRSRAGAPGGGPRVRHGPRRASRTGTHRVIALRGPLGEGPQVPVEDGGDLGGIWAEPYLRYAHWTYVTTRAHGGLARYRGPAAAASAQDS